MAQWHQKHISTEWGVAGIGFILVTVILMIPFIKQEQNLQSHAMRNAAAARPTPPSATPSPSIATPTPLTPTPKHLPPRPSPPKRWY